MITLPVNKPVNLFDEIEMTTESFISLRFKFSQVVSTIKLMSNKVSTSGGPINFTILEGLDGNQFTILDEDVAEETVSSTATLALGVFRLDVSTGSGTPNGVYNLAVLGLT